MCGCMALFIIKSDMIYHVMKTLLAQSVMCNHKINFLKLKLVIGVSHYVLLWCLFKKLIQVKFINKVLPFSKNLKKNILIFILNFLHSILLSLDILSFYTSIN